ncbi:MAG: hypothetical protein MUC49_20465 [Raineya sp.]|jgi:ankyrin repeat protein|nr:hypothetical protein [Raineya sp.]
MKLLFYLCLCLPLGIFAQVKKNTTKPKNNTQKEDTTKPRPVDLALKKALDEKNYILASKYIQEGADINRIDTLMVYRYDSGSSLTRGQGLIALLFPPILAADAVGRHKKIEYTYKHFALWQIAQDSLFTPERYKTMEYLLQKGADPNHYSFKGGSILEKNVLFLDTTATKLLLQYGADIDKVSLGVFDRYEKYTDAETEATQDPQIKDRIYTLVEIFYRRGIKISLEGYPHPRETDLYLKYFPEELNKLYFNACAVCNENIIEHLERKGARATKEELSDALSYITFVKGEKRIERCKRVLKYLISKGADINTYNSSGTRTILHNALSYRENNYWYQVIYFLIENGANPLLKEKDGDTILMRLKNIYQNNKNERTKELKKLIKYVQKQEKIYLAKQQNKQ